MVKNDTKLNENDVICHFMNYINRKGTFFMYLDELNTFFTFKNPTGVIQLTETANLAIFCHEIKFNVTVGHSEFDVMSFLVHFWALPTANF